MYACTFCRRLPALTKCVLATLAALPTAVDTNVMNQCNQRVNASVMCMHEMCMSVGNVGSLRLFSHTHSLTPILSHTTLPHTYSLTHPLSDTPTCVYKCKYRKCMYVHGMYVVCMYVFSTICVCLHGLGYLMASRQVIAAACFANVSACQ